MKDLTRLRWKRTHALNCVRSNMQHLLTEPAKWDQGGRLVGPGFVGLPSWWGFWSDCLKENVRELVRHARALDERERR